MTREEISKCKDDYAFYCNDNTRQQLITYIEGQRETIRTLRKVLKNLVADCLASDFNDCWESYKAALAATEETHGEAE